jgi:hypothetical protein
MLHGKPGMEQVHVTHNVLLEHEKQEHEKCHD